MSTKTLSERYIDEVMRRLPDDQRSDVAEELRTSIADAVEDHPGEDREAAEQAVLTEMGDPVRLAASYADRPLTLIGPALYPSYIQMLKLLLLSILPVVILMLVLIDIVENSDIGSAIGTGISMTLTIGGQMVAWLTVIYAFVDRATGAADKQNLFKGWKPEMLPDRTHSAASSNTGATISMLFTSLVLGLILWQRTGNADYVAGERVQVINPDLWSDWIWPVVVGLGAMAVLEMTRIACGRWTKSLAISFAICEAAVAGALVFVLINEEFFNPEFLLVFNEDLTVLDDFYVAASLLLLGMAAWSIIEKLRQAFKKH